MGNVQQCNNDFISHNSFTPDNIQYLENVLFKVYRIDNYKEVMGRYGQMDLIICFMGKTFKLEVDEENECICLLEKNMCGNPKQKEQYHLVEKFSGLLCLSDSIKYIGTRYKRK